MYMLAVTVWDQEKNLIHISQKLTSSRKLANEDFHPLAYPQSIPSDRTGHIPVGEAKTYM